MAKAQIPIGYTKAEVLGTYGPTTWANVLYLDTSPSDPGDPVDVALAVSRALHALYNPYDASEWSVNWQVTTYKVLYRDAEDSSYRFTLADAIGGTDSGGDQDAQVAYLLNWASGDSRKGGKPRQYIPGVPTSSMLDSARLTSRVVDDLNTQMSNFLAGFPYNGDTTGVCQSLVEMSFVDGKADRVAPLAMPIVSGTINPVVATQRRRIDRLR